MTAKQTQESKDAALWARLQGGTPAAIKAAAERFKVNVSTVRRALAKLGHNPNPVGSPKRNKM